MADKRMREATLCAGRGLTPGGSRRDRRSLEASLPPKDAGQGKTGLEGSVGGRGGSRRTSEALEEVKGRGS